MIDAIDAKLMGLSSQGIERVRQGLRPANYPQAESQGRIHRDVLATQKFLVNMELNCRWARGEDTSGIRCIGDVGDVIRCRVDEVIPSAERLRRCRGRTALIVGAGPSLDRNVDLLTNTDDDIVLAWCKVDVFAVDSVVPVLKACGALRRISYVISCEMDWPGVRPGFEGIQVYLDGIAPVDLVGAELLMNVYGSHGYLRAWPLPSAIRFYIPDLYRYVKYWWPHQEQFPRCLPVVVPRSPNVGFHAIELARLLQYDRVILVGMDMTAREGTHCSGYTREFCDQATQELVFDEMMTEFREVHKYDLGIEVVNCSEGGALTMLPCRPLRDVLQEIGR